MYLRQILKSYTQNMFWISALIWVYLWSVLIAFYIFESQKSKGIDAVAADFLGKIIVMPLLIGVLVPIGTCLVLTLPQLLQTFMTMALFKHFGRVSSLFVLAALPMTAVMTWYCYDYLTPSDLLPLNPDPDWIPYRHGISEMRYITTLEIQTPLTIFSVLYWDVACRAKSKKPLVVTALIIVAVAGFSYGRYRFGSA